MSDSPNRSNSDILIGLLFSTGIMLVVTALPLGIVFAFQFYHDLHDDLRWAIIGGGIMTIVAAIIGFLRPLQNTFERMV
jgi:cytochrome c biogenesis protein CcdA